MQSDHVASPVIGAASTLPAHLDVRAVVPPFDGQWVALGASDAAWDLGLATAESVAPEYVRSLARYFGAYVAESSSAHVDLSLVLFSDRKVVAVWPLFAYRNASGWHLTSGLGPLVPPLLTSPLPERLHKKLIADCLELVLGIARTLGIPEVAFAERLAGGGFDPFHATLMERGARVTTTHTLAVDLTRSLEEIRGNFRKSFRPLVTRGLASWQVDVIASSAPSIFDEFRLLHLEVAGRATRGLDTWTLQHAALVAGEAFLVTLRNKADSRLVGAGYFNTSRTDAVYSVGAYDRSLFQLPLGHVVQYKAIEHMKALGLKRYWIGARPYATDDPSPTEKELQIALFKQGFATHLQPIFRTVLPVTDSLPEQPDA